MSPRPTPGAPIAFHPPRKGTLENRALLPAVIHTLILAALARLFDRLEQLLLLWRTADLPSPVQPKAPRHRTSAPRHRAHRAKSTRRSRTAKARAQQICARKPAPPPNATPTLIPKRPSAPKRRTHDPPQIAPEVPPPKHVQNVTI